MHTGRGQATGIARVDLELTPRTPRTGRRTGLMLGLLAAVVTAAVAGPGSAVMPWASAPAGAVSRSDLRALEKALEHNRMQLRLSEARSRELERQIDTLNQRLREGQEQLTFFRSARNGKP
jgi:TolA-binding protein